MINYNKKSVRISLPTLIFTVGFALSFAVVMTVINIKYAIILITALMISLFAIFIFLRPFFGVWLFFISFPLKIDLPVGGTFFDTNEILVAFLFVVLLLRWIMFGEKFPRISKYFLLFILLILFIIISFLVAHNKEEVIKGIARYIGYLMFYVVVLGYVKNLKQIKLLLVSVILAHTFITFHGFYQAFTLKQYDLILGGNLFRIKSVYNNANYLAAILEYLTLILIGLYWSKTLKSKLIFFGLFSIFVIGVILTQTRTAWIVLVLGILFMLYMRYKGKLLIFLPFLILMAFLFLPFYPDFILKRIKTINDPRNISNKGRIVLLKIGWNMFRDHWFLGTGFENSREVLVHYRLPGVPPHIQDLHNMYMVMFVEIGIIGGSIFVLLFLLPILDNLKTYKRISDKQEKYLALGLGSATLCFALHLLNDYLFIDPRVEWFIWGMLGIITSFNHLVSYDKMFLNDVET